jgi:hypothetical protein
MRRLLALVLFGLAAAGCNNNILGYDQRELLKEPAGKYTGAIPNPWYIYQDGFLTGSWFQGIAVWDNYLWVTVDPASTVQPYAGTRCLRVRYDSAGGGSPSWAETAFIHTSSYATYAGTPGKDLSAGGFHTCKFMLRTSVPATVPFQMDGVSAVNVAATTAWQAVSITLPAPSAQTAVKTFFQVNTPSVNPLDIYIDDLRYEQ